MVKPPRCKTCGKEEWHHVCWVDQPSIGRRYSEAELKKEMAVSVRGVNKPLTPVNAQLTHVPRSVPQSKLTAAEAEIERLLAEVKQLKRLLAEANAKLGDVSTRKDEPPKRARDDMAAYMRKRRAKLKAKGQRNEEQA